MDPTIEVRDVRRRRIAGAIGLVLLALAAALVVRHLRGAPRLAIVGAAVWGADEKVHPDQVLLLDEGKVRAMFAEGAQPIPTGYTQVNARGGFVIPALNDVAIDLAHSGAADTEIDERGEPRLRSDLARYAQLGVLTVRSAGGPSDGLVGLRERSREHPERAQLLVSGPVLTASELATPDRAHARVKELAAAGSDAIALAYDQGSKEQPLPKPTYEAMAAAIEEAHLHHLRVAVQTGSAAEVRDAVRAGADLIERGAVRDALPDEEIAELRAKGVFYDPMLSVLDGFRRIAAKDGFDDDLTEGHVQLAWLEDLAKGAGLARPFRQPGAERHWAKTLELAEDNARRAALGGVRLVVGSGAGAVGSLHAIATHRELQLLHDAGVPTLMMLEAATSNAADALGRPGAGRIAVGNPADLVVLGGDPINDASAYDRIRFVVHDGHLIVHVP